MDVVLTVFAAAAGIAAGWFGGFRLGELVRSRHAALYWSLNVIVVVAGLVGEVIGLGFRMPWLYIASIAFIAASFTGLKYGRGKTVGPGSRTAPEPEDREIPRPWED